MEIYFHDYYVLLNKVSISFNFVEYKILLKSKASKSTCKPEELNNIGIHILPYFNNFYLPYVKN